MTPKKADEVPAVGFALFSSIVAHAFGQRRKTLRNALGKLLPAEAIADCGIDPGARAEVLPLEAFVALAQKAAELGVKPVIAGAAPD